MQKINSGAEFKSIKLSLKQEDNEKRNIVHYAVESEDSELTKYILKQSRNCGCKEIINKHKSDGETPLHIASDRGFPDIVDVLCGFGANTQGGF